MNKKTRKIQLLSLGNEKMCFSVCRRAISDFKKLKPSVEALAELMVSYMECAIKCTYDYGAMWEEYCESVAVDFDNTMQFIVMHDLWDTIWQATPTMCPLVE